MESAKTSGSHLRISNQRKSDECATGVQLSIDVCISLEAEGGRTAWSSATGEFSTGVKIEEKNWIIQFSRDKKFKGVALALEGDERKVSRIFPVLSNCLKMGP